MTSVSTPYPGFEYQEFHRRRQQQSSVFLTPSIFNWYQQLLQKHRVYFDQAYAATAWVAEQGALIGVDASRLAVAGDGVGGTLATVTTLLAKERGGPHIECQVLLYPVADANFETLSYREFGAEGYWLT